MNEPLGRMSDERMLDIGLCMLVKNEEANVVACLEPIVDLFAEVVIVDTGSTDRTRELLSERFGITALRAGLDAGECFALATQRNRGFDLLRTPWLLTLDADERIDREELKALISQPDAGLPAGLFCAWTTDVGQASLVEDYKLCFFRKGHHHSGLIHDTAQPSLRRSNEAAAWAPQVRLRHYPDVRRQKEKDDWYGLRLRCAMAREPGCLRYPWFSGYMAYRAGRFAEARVALERVHGERPVTFPVESLNASMVLAAIHAQCDRPSQAAAVIDNAQAYHRRVQGDFEVQVNFRMGPWLEQAAQLAASGRYDAIRPYEFAY
jgi:glycosyltransferase involved in cell wall biosynthesis